MKIADFFYTEAEVADIINVNRITIWRWVRKGKFDSERIGRGVLIPKWQVELFKTKSKNVKKGHNFKETKNA